MSGLSWNEDNARVEFAEWEAPGGGLVWDSDLVEMFEQELDQAPDIVISVGGWRFGYAPSRVLKAVDPIAFSEAYKSWTNAHGYKWRDL